MATLRTAVSTMQPLMSSARSSMSKISLTQSLTTPAKVAHMFDWKKSSNNILTLHITKQAIECAVASHPTMTNRITSISNSSMNSSNLNSSRSHNTTVSVTSLPSIPLTRDIARDVTLKPGTIPSFHVPSVMKALQEVIQDHNVCGIVVVYPTNTDNGNNNAACGRALHVLDHLSFSGSTSNGSTKPICLYDPNTHYHHAENVASDEWGRSPLYTTTSVAKVVHCAKQPQSEKNSTLLQETWYNFVHQYWPGISNSTSSDTSYGDYDFNDYDSDDLSEFIAKLNKNKTCAGDNSSNKYRAPMYHVIDGGDNHSNEHKKNLVYQSAF